MGWAFVVLWRAAYSKNPSARPESRGARAKPQELS